VEWSSVVALVTGASTGIGRAAALDLLSRGATVIGLARGRDKLEALADETGGKLKIIAADVGDAELIASRIGDLVRAHGRIDLLVNNAGTGTYRSAEQTPPSVFASIMRTNYLGAVHTTLAVLPHMLEKRSGHIVNVSSPSAIAPPAGQTAYAASKAALDAFSESLLLEVRDRGVRVSLIYPGHVMTPLTTVEFKGQPLPPKSVCMSAERVARSIARAVETGAFRVYMPWFVGLTPVVKGIAPELVRRQTMKAQPWSL
jgi:short-subunit dehydrogenase